MEKGKIHDRRQVKLENILKTDYIPFLSGRPEREWPINEDDLSNLAIALNTSNTIEDFLKKV